MLSLVEIGERADHAARINELILQACKEAGCTLAEIAAVALSRGPGSYTSLRVGTATAKGICFALNKPLLAVDTLQAIARASRQGDSEKCLYAPMIDARRMEVYTTFYDGHLRVLEPAHPLVVTSEVFSTYLENGYRIVISGNGAEKCIPVLPGEIRFNPVFCSAAHLAAPAHRRFRRNQFEELAYYEPFYLKSPNITQSRRRL